MINSPDEAERQNAARFIDNTIKRGREVLQNRKVTAPGDKMAAAVEEFNLAPGNTRHQITVEQITGRTPSPSPTPSRSSSVSSISSAGPAPDRTH